MKLVGEVAIVTGGSKGIGYAVADLLMAHGADVAITSRTTIEIEDAAVRLTGAHDGRCAVGVAGDASNAADVARVFDVAEEQFGAVAILVNNAGISTLNTIADLSEDDFDSVINSNLKSTFLGTKEAIRRMRSSGIQGAIVNTGSLELGGTTRGNAHYAAAKAGVAKLSEVAALEAGRSGIRVNTVAPGVIGTPMSVTNPDLDAAWHQSFTIDRMGRPEDIAQTVVFLASNYSSWITGTTILVDGGTHLRGLPDYAAHLLPGRE